MSNNKFLANESTSVSATKLSTWDNTGTVGEKIPANVPTNPDGSAHAQALTDTQLRASPVDVTFSGTSNVAVTSSVLPTGAATSSLQTTLNSSVSSLDSKAPPLGQALAAASVPVVLTAAQLATLTPPTTVTANIGTTAGIALDSSLTTLNAKDFATEATLALIKAKTDNIDVALSTRTKPSDAQNIRALTSGDQVTIANASVPVTGAFFQATQPVSIASSVAVTGPLTDAQLRAAVVPVSLASTTISNFPATQAVSNTLETASTGTITSVTNAVTSFSVLATNANRKGFVIHNDSTTTVFIAFAATASATAFTLRLTSQASYISNSLPIYRGAISGIASAANGSLRITELT